MLDEAFKFYGVSQKSILSQIISREIENSNIENRDINRNLDILIEYEQMMKQERKLVHIIGINYHRYAAITEKIKEAERYYE